MTTFDQAIVAVKNGKRARRAVWPEGAFIYLVPGSNFTVSRAPLEGIYPRGTEIQYMPHIDFAYGDGRCCVWEISQESVLASDWSIQEQSV